MAGNHSRRKGSSAERELFSLLSEYLGIVCKRNLVQTREGGADCIDIPGLAIEVKRRAKWPNEAELSEMWKQTLTEAHDRAAVPMLWIRADRGRWWAALRLCDVAEHTYPGARECCLMRFEPAVQWIREQL